MIENLLLGVAVAVQTIATLYAIRLIRQTRYNAVWILFIVGFSILSVERILQASGIEREGSWTGVYIVMDTVISLTISIAVMFARKLIDYVNQIDNQKEKINRRILNAVLRAEESSKADFSQQLHDDLGPLLSSAKMSLSALSAESMGDTDKKIIANTSFVIDQAVRTLREVSNRLSPQALMDGGLVRGVEQFVSRLSLPQNQKIIFHTNIKDDRFDLDIEVILYRVVCELVTNSLKHASCTTMSINLTKFEDFLILEYTDNGRGFSPEAVIDCGMGLSNIASRIQSINGVFNITSNKGEGCHVNVKVRFSSRYYSKITY